MSVEGGPDIVTDGLVLHLDAANNRSFVSGSTTWFDLSGNRNTGSLVNGPTYNSANNGTVVFDGTDDYIDCGSSNLFVLGNNFTLDCWVYPTQLGSVDGDELLSLGTGATAPYASYGLEWMNTGKFRFLLGNTSDQFLSYLSNTTYSPNIWYHVCETYNGATVILYVNAVIENSVSVSTTIKYLANRLTIGSWYYGIGTNSITGRIPVVKLYNRALSAKEIRQNYNASKGRYGLF